MSLAVQPYDYQNHSFYDRTDVVQSVRGLELVLDSGTFTLDVDWMFEISRAAEILRGYVEFTPHYEAPGCANISLIQAARLDLELYGDSVWGGGEANREKMKTREDQSQQIVGHYYIDHQANFSPPQSQRSPFFRDSWPNAKESADGFISKGSTRSASLVDYPYGWDSTYGMDRISLETCAVCRENGYIYGCVQWGAQRPLSPWSQREVFFPRARSEPTATFSEALRLFKDFYRFEFRSQP